MNQERYEKLKEIFVEVMDLPRERQADRLDESCGDNGELRSEIEGLLEGYDRDETLAGLDLVDSIKNPAMPEKIGRYAVLGVLGAGGMGMVYRARQEHPNRDVAVKVLHSGLRSPQMLHRFELEAEVLGLLQHPGIAQVYEAGRYSEGTGTQPFFALELVEGVCLTAYAQSRGLSTRERLELFVQVCDAVQHAHLKGVVHRDLKPGNILVKADGQPKILDFGIARITDSDIQATTMQTDTTQLMGTIPYMSPEQVCGNPRAIESRSDVYSLGVLLYELLSGKLPHDGREKSIPEMVRAIRDDDPAPLGSIRRTLRGDLETIVAKALEKEPQRRYQSAQELASDIKRYLAEQPIEARPATTVYQLRKFARRNRGLVAGLVAAMVILVAGTAASMVFAHRANMRSGELEIEAAKLESLNGFLVDLIQSVNPEVTSVDVETPSDVRIADVLDYAAQDLASAYAGQPEVEIEIRKTLAASYWQVEMRQESQEQYDAAIALAQAHFGERHPETVRLQVERWSTGFSLVPLEVAEIALRGLLVQCEEIFGEDHEVTISCLNSVVATLFYQERNREGIALAEDAVERCRRGLTPEHYEYLDAMGTLGHFMSRLGKPLEAEKIFRSNIETRTRLVGENHVSTIRSKSSLVSALRDAGKKEAAIEVMREVVDAQSVIYGPESSAVMFSTANLAVLYREEGDREGARRTFQEILDTRTRTLGPLDPDTLGTKRELAKTIIDMGDLEQAETLLQELLSDVIVSEAVESFNYAAARNCLGRVRTEQGQHAAAVDHYAAAVETGRAHLGEDHPATDNFRQNYAACLLALGETAAAEEQLLQGFESSVRRFGERHAIVAGRANKLAEFYEQWEKPEQAAIWREHSAKPDGEE